MVSNPRATSSLVHISYKEVFDSTDMNKYRIILISTVSVKKRGMDKVCIQILERHSRRLL